MLWKETMKRKWLPAQAGLNLTTVTEEDEIAYLFPAQAGLIPEYGTRKQKSWTAPCASRAQTEPLENTNHARSNHPAQAGLNLRSSMQHDGNRGNIPCESRVQPVWEPKSINGTNPLFPAQAGIKLETTARVHEPLRLAPCASRA